MNHLEKAPRRGSNTKRSTFKSRQVNVITAVVMGVILLPILPRSLTPSEPSAAARASHQRRVSAV